MRYLLKQISWRRHDRASELCVRKLIRSESHSVWLCWCRCVVHFWLHRPSPSHASSPRAPTTCSSITPTAPHAGLPFAHLPSSPPPSFNISECVSCVSL